MLALALRPLYAITLASLLIRHGKTLAEQVNATSLMLLPGITSALLLSAGLLRLIAVVMNRDALMAPSVGVTPTGLKRFGALLICCGAAVAVLHAFTYCLIGNPLLAAAQGSSPVGFYVAMALLSDIGAAGILIYEISRLQAFSSVYRIQNEQNT